MPPSPKTLIPGLNGHDKPPATSAEPGLGQMRPRMSIDKTQWSVESQGIQCAAAIQPSARD